MPHKKREKELSCAKNSKKDNTQADHELFLQAFESKSRITFVYSGSLEVTNVYNLLSLPKDFSVILSVNPSSDYFYTFKQLL